MTNAEGGSTKYQTIVFQKENRVRIPQQISASSCRPHLRLPSHCYGALTSFTTCGGPRHSQNSWVKYKLTKHTQAYTQSPWAWEHCEGAARLVPGTKQAGDSPPSALGGEKFLWVCKMCLACTALDVFFLSFSEIGLNLKHHTIKTMVGTRENIGRRELRSSSRVCYFPTTWWGQHLVTPMTHHRQGIPIPSRTDVESVCPIFCLFIGFQEKVVKLSGRVKNGQK